MDERNNHFDFDFTPIGQAIKKAREARGMTREELSGIIGYAPRHLQAIENEGQYPSLEAALIEKLEQAREAEKELNEQSAVCDSGDSEFIEKYRGLAGIETLTKEQVADLLERVTVFPGERLEIKLRFLDGNGNRF